MARRYPKTTNDRNAIALMNDSTPLALWRELSDHEIAAVAGGRGFADLHHGDGGGSGVQLPIIVENRHSSRGTLIGGTPIGSYGPL
ncbi:MAG: hypothetical protein ACLQGP_10395 [Isosphaeraceae bacterium]